MTCKKSVHWYLSIKDYEVNRTLVDPRHRLRLRDLYLENKHLQSHIAFEYMINKNHWVDTMLNFMYH